MPYQRWSVRVVTHPYPYRMNDPPPLGGYHDPARDDHFQSLKPQRSPSDGMSCRTWLWILTVVPTLAVALGLLCSGGLTPDSVSRVFDRFQRGGTAPAPVEDTPSTALAAYLAYGPNLDDTAAELECEQPELKLYHAHMQDLYKRQVAADTPISVDQERLDESVDGDRATVDATVGINSRTVDGRRTGGTLRVGYKFGLVREGTWKVCSAQYLGPR